MCNEQRRAKKKLNCSKGKVVNLNRRHRCKGAHWRLTSLKRCFKTIYEIRINPKRDVNLRQVAKRKVCQMSCLYWVADSVKLRQTMLLGDLLCVLEFTSTLCACLIPVAKLLKRLRMFFIPISFIYFDM